MHTLKVLLSGGSGFVGTNFIRYVAQYPGIDVRCIARKDLTAGNYQLQDIDTLVHLAGKAHDVKKVSDPSEYYDVNFELTKKLYNTFLRSNASKFIFISSVKAVADDFKDILTEETTAYPLTDYGKSKLLAEEYIQAQELPFGKLFFILRPCMIHGRGNKGNLNLLYKFVSKNIPWPLGSFDNNRSFLSVENLCFVLKELIERDDMPKGVYNVSDDGSLSTNELVNIIATELKHRPRIWKWPKNIIQKIARIGDVVPLPLNSERLKKLTSSYLVSNKKLKSTLNKQLPVTLKDGISITVRSFPDKT